MNLTPRASSDLVLFLAPGAGKTDIFIFSHLREWRPPCSDAYLEDLDDPFIDFLTAVLMGTGDTQVHSPLPASLLLGVLRSMLIAVNEVTPEKPTERAVASRVKARPRRTRRRRARPRHLRSRRVRPSACRPRTRLFSPVRRRKAAHFISSTCAASPALAAMALCLPYGRRHQADNPDPCPRAVTERHRGAVSS